MKTLLLSLVTFTAANLNAQPAPPLLERLKDENARGTDLWIYNNLQGAMAEAKRTGKPIFVTFRCVPCHACKAFDAEVAKGQNVIRELAEKHFISLRQVEMKGVDLSLFQFDWQEMTLVPGLLLLATVVGFLPALAAYRTDVAKALSAG